jgi:hypothetical protein
MFVPLQPKQSALHMLITYSASKQVWLVNLVGWSHWLLCELAAQAESTLQVSSTS